MNSETLHRVTKALEKEDEPILKTFYVINAYSDCIAFQGKFSPETVKHIKPLITEFKESLNSNYYVFIDGYVCDVRVQIVLT